MSTKHQPTCIYKLLYSLFFNQENLVLSNVMIKVELPPWIIWKADVRHSLWRGANARNVSFTNHSPTDASAFQITGESGWFSGHQPCLPPLWPRFNSGLGSYVGWVSVDLNLTPRVFLRVLRFSSLLKIDSRPIPSGCGAVLRGHTWVMFRGRAPSRQHSFFGPTSLSCALSYSVSDCEKGRLADQIFLSSFFSFFLSHRRNKLEIGLVFFNQQLISWFLYRSVDDVCCF